MRTPMPTRTSFKSRDLTVGKVLGITKSIGAHIASKLQQFGSDERTLTDELCEMFFIWGDERIPAEEVPSASSVLNQVLDVELEKFSQSREAEIGAYFALRIGSPLGQKRALFQVKVFDPDL